MKDIKGHKSYNQDEIIDILIKSGTYTCPTLPHYRYDRVKRICSSFEKMKIVKRSGKNEVSVNLVVSDRFLEWNDEKQKGLTNLGIIKWVKQKYPKNIKIKNCPFCHAILITRALVDSDDRINSSWLKCPKCPYDQRTEPTTGAPDEAAN